MSELTDELAQGFASAEMQSEPQQEQSNVTEEQPQTQDTAVIENALPAPVSYTKEFQDSFKTLSPDWQKYLVDREKQVERGFSDMGNKVNNYKWIDDIYSSRQDRLSGMGFTKAQDYINTLTAIDDAMAKDPYSTLKALADAYKVDFNDNNTAYNSLQNQFSDMQKQISGFQSYINQQTQSKAEADFKKFMDAKDENGNPKHAYFEDVRQDMIDLMQKGISNPNDYEDAYNKAIWLNNDVRNKIMASQNQAVLSNKVAEATKAKEASFSPKSKAPAPVKELDLREELAKQFEGI